MKRELPQLRIQNNRVRGCMPFRRSRSERKLLHQDRRTGEPSPALPIIPISHDEWFEKRDSGYGKASGSYTEKLRIALSDWMKKEYGTEFHDLTFTYKLYRHKIVMITGSHPYIRHDPNWGKGLRGFQLVIHIKSIDGVQYRGFQRPAVLAFDRIVARQKIFLLGESN